MRIKWEGVARRGKNHAVLIMDEVAESYKKKLGSENLPDFNVEK